MYSFKSLHDLRQIVGIQNQPRFTPEMNDLNSSLVELGVNHPFSLTEKERDQFLLNDNFSSSSKGIPVTSLGNFLFRITSIGKLIRSVTRWKLDQTLLPSVIYSLIKAEYGIQEDWLSLDDYAEGWYSSPRKFTFWTSLDISNEHNLSKSLNLIGFPKEWVSSYSILLRIETAQLKTNTKIRVPTCIDGFDSPIFHPAVENSSLLSGMTIDINEPSSLRFGTTEYILEMISAKNIFIKPLDIKPSTLRSMTGIGTPLIQSLHAFHKNNEGNLYDF